MLDDKIMELKSEMYEAIDRYGVSSEEALVVSQKLDTLIAKKQFDIYQNQLQ